MDHLDSWYSLHCLMAPLNPVLAESFLRRPYRKDTKAGVLVSNTSGFQFNSVQSLSHVWLQPHELQHAKLPCPSSSPWVCSNSWPLSWWCHPTILSCVVPFFCLQSFPTSGSFPMSQFFISGGHSIEASASAPDLPVNSQGWCPLELTGVISLLSKTLKSLLQHQIPVTSMTGWIWIDFEKSLNFPKPCFLWLWNGGNNIQLMNWMQWKCTA